MDPSRKRGRPEAAANGGFRGANKKPREMESFETGVGSKSKPCTKFFSTSGCPFGETCHFLHFFPGGYKAVAAMLNLPGPAPPSAATSAPPPTSGPHYPPADPTTPAPTKTRLCTRYNSAEGCKFGDSCRYAHGPRELGKPVAVPTYNNTNYNNNNNPPPTHHLGYPPTTAGPPGFPAADAGPAPGSFGASATAKISVDASLAGAIIGKGGVNTKQICRSTGAKLAIRDHESDTNLKNIELEGTFDQIKQASAMVRELIVSISGSGAAGPTRSTGAGPGGHGHYKTKLCENFAKGSCTYGDKCNFAHGSSELRMNV